GERRRGRDGERERGDAEETDREHSRERDGAHGAPPSERDRPTPARGPGRGSPSHADRDPGRARRRAPPEERVSRLAVHPLTGRPSGKDMLAFLFLQCAALALLLIASVNAAGLLLRSEEHTSELQSRENLVCRLLLD